MLLIAVLTCVVDDEAQRDLVAEVTAALTPCGHLYVSDLVLQGGQRYRGRYDTSARNLGVPYGTFATGDGALCRHHDIAHLRSLFGHLTVVQERRIQVSTMNGNEADAVQLLLRKAAPAALQR